MEHGEHSKPGHFPRDAKKDFMNEQDTPYSGSEHGKGGPGHWVRSAKEFVSNGFDKGMHAEHGSDHGKPSGHWARDANPDAYQAQHRYEHGQEGSHPYEGPAGAKKGSGVHWPRKAEPCQHGEGEFKAEHGYGPVEHDGGSPSKRHWRRETGEEHMGNGEYKAQKGKPLKFGGEKEKGEKGKGWF